MLSLLLPAARAATINVGIPGTIASSSDPAGIIVNLYQFGMLLAGILAFGIIVWAGIQYSVSRSNPGMQADARDRIFQAFFGILLLVGAYTILYTLNPGLTVLQLPKLAPIDKSLLGEATSSFRGGIPLTRQQISDLNRNNPGWRRGPGGQCVDGAGTACSQENVGRCGAWDAAKASRICMAESGGNQFAESGTDRCTMSDGRTPSRGFSIGLYQVNLFAHPDKIPAECQNLFVKEGGSTLQGNCVDCRNGGRGNACTDGVCYRWSCKFVGTEEKYAQCKQAMARVNLDIACRIYQNQSASKKWQPWAWSTAQVCRMPLSG